jgi:hypothetical protein
MRKTELVVALFVAVLVAAFVGRYMMANRAPVARETFMQQEIGAPSGGTSMGPYDSKSQPGASGWLPNEKAPEGASPVGETQNGNLMFLNDPKVSQSCCPSAFNTDQGCVCLSDSDKQLMASRGGNRN